MRTQAQIEADRHDPAGTADSVLRRGGMKIHHTHTTDKYCPRCETVKTVSDFGKSSGTRDGLTCYCRNCANEYSKRIYRTNAEVIREKRRERYRKEKSFQPSLFQSPTRPASGPRCGCGRVLMHYEVRLGKCLRCVKIAIQQAKNWTPAVGERG